MAVQTDQLDRWKSCLPGISSSKCSGCLLILGCSCPPSLQLKFPANSCLESSAPCIPHNLLLGDEKNSQEDVYFSFADCRTDVCVQTKSQTVKLFVWSFCSSSKHWQLWIQLVETSFAPLRRQYHCLSYDPAWVNCTVVRGNDWTATLIVWHPGNARITGQWCDFLWTNGEQ
jgi:hypothetical protein